MSRRTEIRELLTRHYRRLQKLREQKAAFGISTPPHMLLEIEDIEEEVKVLQYELKTLEQKQAKERTLNKKQKVNQESQHTQPENIGAWQEIIETIEGFLARLREIQEDTSNLNAVGLINREELLILPVERFDRLGRTIYQFLTKNVSEEEGNRFASQANLPFNPFSSDLSSIHTGLPPGYSFFGSDDIHKKHLTPAILYLIALKESIAAGDIDISSDKKN